MRRDMIQDWLLDLVVSLWATIVVFLAVDFFVQPA